MGEAAEGIVLSSNLAVAGAALPDGDLKTQIDDFAAVWAESDSAADYPYPPQFAFEGAAALQLIKAAIEAAGTTDHAAVRDALEGLDVLTVVGRKAYSPTDHVGSTTADLAIVQIQGGDFVAVAVHDRALRGSRRLMNSGEGGRLLLEIDGVSRSFGGVRATDDVRLAVAEGELRGVIGPNGAGKSTLFNLVSGHLTPSTGTISLGGTRIDRLPPHRRAALGVAIVFQGARLFPGLSVLENVAVGAHARTRSGVVSAILRTRRSTSRGTRDLRRRP